MDATPNQNHELHYAPRPPVHKQRRFQRYLYLIAVIFLVGSSIYWGPNAWRRVQILYWQRQCLNYEVLPNQVVFEFVDGKQMRTTIPVAWQEFYSRYSPPGFQSLSTLFLHEMQLPNGDRRLVAVDLIDPQWMTWHPYAATSRRVFQPATFFRQVDQVHFSSMGAWNGPMPAAPHHLLIYAGQIDPDDPTHFTIEYDADGKHGMVDGWLREDLDELLRPGGRIILESREEPSTQPSPSSPAKSP